MVYVVVVVWPFTKYHLYNLLCFQFYLKEADLGQNRALCSEKQLSSLNVYVQVSSWTSKLNEDFLSKFQVSYDPVPYVCAKKKILFCLILCLLP